MKYKRIFLVVLDSVGIGGAKDASEYNDQGANTVFNTVYRTKIRLPYLTQAGLLNLVELSNEKTNSHYARVHEASKGKDTLTGHLEMVGIESNEPPKTFDKFPDDLMNALESSTSHKFIGNEKASGTEIIERLGQEHLDTKKPIIYTSADSVMQIAAHEEEFGLDELYNICEIARKLTKTDEWKVGRIIARPFKGKPGNFVRTENRKDYALKPSAPTVLDNLKELGYSVISIGKVSEIFDRQGITDEIKTKDNLDGIDKIAKLMKQDFKGLCFANLNDFDTLFGHRRDIIGYANTLKEFDINLPTLKVLLKEDDLLILTADHGNDPTHEGTDHTRENVPLIVYNRNFKEGKNLGEFFSFADIGATIAENFEVETPETGESFLSKL